MSYQSWIVSLVVGAAALTANIAEADGYYARSSFQLHSAATEDSTVDPATVAIGTLVDDVGSPMSRNSWVRVHFVSDGVDHQGWVHRSLLAGSRDFKRVQSCWPVQRSAATSGEAPWDVDFSENGAATMQSQNAGPSMQGHVYRAGNIVFVRAVRKVPNSVSIFGVNVWGLAFVFDDKTSQLQALDYDSKTIWTPKKMPAGCRAPSSPHPASAP